jgi:hypothetical protein
MRIEITNVRELKDGSTGFNVKLEGISIEGWRYQSGEIKPPGAIWKGRYYPNVNPFNSDMERWNELTKAIKAILANQQTSSTSSPSPGNTIKCWRCYVEDTTQTVRADLSHTADCHKLVKLT